MKLFNSLTNSLETFTPIEPGKVSMYVCGPTVYNHAHIGNARPIIIFDTLRRLFEAMDYKVEYISNFTDVDDKIINKALEEGVDEQVIAQRYIDAYNLVRSSLNTKPLDATPKVTNTMEEIIVFIQELLDRGYAYHVDGDVYFRVSKVNNYGIISKQNIDDLVVGARVEENTKKESPLDFALWKQTEVGIKWGSSFGEGRPGWHTECVVMIDKHFHHKIDIHGGGMDLKFPHHENEVAQSQAVFGHGLANYWLHNGMLNIDGEKMSKSLGNVRWAKDVIEKLGTNTTRWMMQSAHYRAPLNLNDEAVEQANTELNKIFTVLKQAYVKLGLLEIPLKNITNHQLYLQFIEAMSDDLNTPNAFSVVFETVKQLNAALRQREIDSSEVSELTVAIEKMLEILGINNQRLVLTDKNRELYNQWQQAKINKDFALADTLRLQLTEAGLL